MNVTGKIRKLLDTGHRLLTIHIGRKLVIRYYAAA